MQDEATNREGTAEVNQDEELRRGHEESLAATQDLARQVEAAEQAAGKPTPSQADADETAATGI
jgi:hypothetical protein